MCVVAQARSASFPLHQGGIWIGGTDSEIGQALVMSSRHPSVRFSCPFYPIMALAIDIRQFFMHLRIKSGMELTGKRELLLLNKRFLLCWKFWLCCSLKQPV